jgi:CPA1 family monovalent cation:H+ antiporter
LEQVIVAALVIFVGVLVGGFISRVLPVAIPLPLVQIAVGGAIAGVTDLGLRLEPAVFFLLFLPPLLFLDGWRVPKDALRRNARTIAELAFGLVFISVLVIGYLVHWMFPTMPLPVAFALAAALSPTDAVAVGAIVRRAPPPKRVQDILDGEALLNDASGLVCMRFAVAAVATGSFSLLDASADFLWLALAGFASGVGVTLAVTWFHRFTGARIGEEPGARILASLLIPFGAYLLAERLQASGILAAVGAGFTMAAAEQSGRALPITRMRRAAVWDMVRFALNGAMFVLIGEQLPTIAGNAAAALNEAQSSPALILVHTVLVTIALIALRFAWVWVTLRLRQARLATPDPKGTNLRLLLFASFAGVRGSITLAGILTLPLHLNGAPFPARDLAITIAAGVVILSMALAGLVLPRLLRGLELPREDDEMRFERRARKVAAQAAIEAIERAQQEEHPGPNAAADWIQAAARVSDTYRAQIDGMADGEEAEALRRTEGIERQLRLAALRAERATYFRLGRERKLSDSIVRRLVSEVDQAETRLAPTADAG